MSRTLAIDPGPVESGYTLINAATHRPIEIGKISNQALLDMLDSNRWNLDLGYDHGCIEMIASYGMPVGQEVFETCVWIGRFQQAAPIGMRLIYRKDVKLHHCGTTAAKDPNIIQALIDRFASGKRNRGKGTKAEPGWFFGFKDDIWQAYALAVYDTDNTGGTS